MRHLDEVIGIFDDVEEISAELRKGIVYYIQLIGDLADWLWKITAVPVTAWHMQCIKRGSVGNT